jgi:hypothetical protein
MCAMMLKLRRRACGMITMGECIRWVAPSSDALTRRLRSAGMMTADHRIAAGYRRIE